MSRRAFVQGLGSLGAAAGSPFAAIAAGPSTWRSGYKPTRAGGGGTLKLLWWQAPTLLNPHFAVGGKDQEGCRLFYEPLASWDDDGRLVPVLAAEIPSIQNGGLSADRRSVLWRLKPDVRWHDGRPFTADDVVFNWRYASDPATAATTIGVYRDIKVETRDAHSVIVTFDRPTPFWADAFVSGTGLLIPQHLFAPYAGERSRDAPANHAPVGTGPYRFTEFRPGDMLRGTRNTDYHVPLRPHFDVVEMKGGGDSVSAARAVLQTGDYDFASAIQVEDDILTRMEAAGRGRIEAAFGGNLEFILLNATDPDVEVDGERSSLRTEHFAFRDPAVRHALSLVIDRGLIQAALYGRTGRATANSLNGPAAFVSRAHAPVFDVDAANRLLDEAGWIRDEEGIRSKGGRPLRLVFQTTLNAARQKTQAIIKRSARQAGIDIEIKAVPASVYFSSDVGNPDTFSKFYADMEMLTGTMIQPDPTRWMMQYVSWEAASKANKWQGRNVARVRAPELDDLFRRAQAELDEQARAGIFVAMNDLAVTHNVIPLIHRAKVSALGARLVAPPSAWDNDLWSIAEWFNEA